MVSTETAFVVTVPFENNWTIGDAFQGRLYGTYYKAREAARCWLDEHPGYTWEDLEIEEWKVL